ncbi:MAG TPA: hypothetical protein VF070_49425 [Streptosporangiaceae bacterium]
MTRPVTRGALGAAAVVAAGVLLFAGYLRLSGTVIVGSDGGTIALQAWDMLHGNVLLHGWAMSDVSFYSTELPEYVLVERLHGLSPDVVHIAGALTYTIAVLLAAWLAKGRATGREGVTRALMAAGIMLAPAPGFGTSTLLLSPDHFGSTIPVLLAWVVIDRCEVRNYVPVLVGVILAVGVVADPLAEVTGVAPMVLICGIRAVQRARRDEPWWFEASLVTAAVAAVGAAAIVLALIRAAGGFVVSPVSTGFAGLAALPHHLFLAGQGILLLFGASFIRGQPVNMLLSVLHLVGVAMAAAALCISLRRLFRLDEIVLPALAMAIILNIALYVLGRYPVDPLSTREISAVLPLSAVLAGRTLAAYVLRTRLVPVLSAVLAGYALTLGIYGSQPQVPALHQDLAGWLVARGLVSGLAPGYWLANITTVDSGGRARVIQVSAGDGKVTRPVRWETSASWYQPDSDHADFLVTDATPGSPAWRSAVAAARATFGPPAQIRRYEQYTIIIWTTNVLSYLH